MFGMYQLWGFFRRWDSFEAISVKKKKGLSQLCIINMRRSAALHTGKHNAGLYAATVWFGK